VCIYNLEKISITPRGVAIFRRREDASKSDGGENGSWLLVWGHVCISFRHKERDMSWAKRNVAVVCLL
jgi:hypothetical protein